MLVRTFAELSAEHSSHPHAQFASEMLVETLSILKRFASLEALCPTGVPTDELRLQRALVALLSTREALVLQCVLVAIHQFVQLEGHLTAIGQLGCAEILLRILTDYEESFRALAAELIELLLRERTFLQDIVLHDGTSALLSALASDDVSVQLPILRTLERLAAHAECVCAREIRQVGGINVLLSLLSGQGGQGGQGSSAQSITPASQHPQRIVAVAICSVLTALALDDEAALQIRKANGVFLLGQLLLNGAHEETAIPSAATATLPIAGSQGATSTCVRAIAATEGTDEAGHRAESKSETSHELLAAHVFRTLRFVFSTERNRKIFQRLFPPDLFAAFIDLGHYVRDLERYVPLAAQLSRLSAETRTRMQEALADINVIKGPSRHYVKDYAVQELLGRGAFGRVYQVKKDTGATLYAMKELPIDALAADEVASANGRAHCGTAADGVADSQQIGGSMRREVKILSTLQHPNIIRYYESFLQGSALYIVMELVEGATLLDHLNSLLEKGHSMAESRIWSIFTQICLALRYIHKERNVVHRDLTPSNVMINADGVVKVADFGLAKQRMGTNSVMESVVGTVLYQCPEIIQNQPYGEKADIWSLGCILYQTAMLRPPFEGSNPLSVAQAIVEGTYPPLRGSFAPLLQEVVSRLLCVDPEERPDIDVVASLISSVLMTELERSCKAEHSLRAEVHIERDFRQRHEREASRNKEAVHRLFARHQVGMTTRGGSGRGVAGSSATNGRAVGAHREVLEPSPLRRSAQSRSPMLSISQSRIREIHDPCSLILNQLHKILFISQLPPSMEGHQLTAERHLIEKYKRELFSHRNHYRGRNLKDELHKVFSGSQEVIDMSFTRTATSAEGVDGALHAKQRVSYEEMQVYIEQVLAETGYYALHATDDDRLDAPIEWAANEHGVAAPDAALRPAGPSLGRPEPPGISRASSMPEGGAPARLRAGPGSTARAGVDGRDRLPPMPPGAALPRVADRTSGHSAGMATSGTIPVPPAM